MTLIDFNSPEFREELKKIIEETLETYKMKVIRETFLTREEFKEEMDKWRQELNKIWEAIQKQREDFQKQREDFQEQREDFQKQNENHNRHFKQIEVSLYSLEGKTGIDLHNLILDLMKEALQLENIDWKKIRTESLVDKEGKVYTQDYSTDIDVLLDDGIVYLIEVKATADNRDVQDLLDKGELYQYLTRRTPTRLILLTLSINRVNYQFAVKKKLRVIAGEIL